MTRSVDGRELLEFAGRLIRSDAAALSSVLATRGQNHTDPADPVSLMDAIVATASEDASVDPLSRSRYCVPAPARNNKAATPRTIGRAAFMVDLVFVSYDGQKTLVAMAQKVPNCGRAVSTTRPTVDQRAIRLFPDQE